MANRLQQLIYSDFTGRRVRAFPLLREFGDAKSQHDAYNHAQRTALRKHQVIVFVVVCLSLAGGLATQLGTTASLVALAVLLTTCVWLSHRFKQFVEVELRQYFFDKNTHCHHCCYSLIGNTSGRCPECGMAIPDDHRRLINRCLELSDANLNLPPCATDNDDSECNAASGGQANERPNNDRTTP